MKKLTYTCEIESSFHRPRQHVTVETLTNNLSDSLEHIKQEVYETLNLEQEELKESIDDLKREKRDLSQEINGLTNEKKLYEEKLQKLKDLMDKFGVSVEELNDIPF